MWIAEGSELIHINPEFDDKTGEFSVKFQNYDPNDGLQNSDFNQRSFAILPDGEILIGGLYGINHFDPSKITLNRTLPKVMFSRLYLGNNEITPKRTHSIISLKDSTPIGRFPTIIASHTLTYHPESTNYWYQRQIMTITKASNRQNLKS